MESMSDVDSAENQRSPPNFDLVCDAKISP